VEADSRCHLSAGFVVNPRAYHVFATTWAEACARRRLDARTQPDPRINERDPCTILFVDTTTSRFAGWLGGAWSGGDTGCCSPATLWRRSSCC
jgi:hypothetical protein